MGVNWLEHTERISFELSRSCPCSKEHVKCPLHLRETEGPGYLPSSIIYESLQIAGHAGFEGTIAFHNYNEPLIDPRLFRLIACAKTLCRKSKTYLLTNGFQLDQIMIDELDSCGLDKITVSAYDDKEFARLSRIIVPSMMDFNMQRLRGFDDRLSIYDRDPTKWEQPQPCYAPIRSVLVNHDGTVGLCCYDWQKRNIFGNLREERIDEILSKREVLETYNRLSQGDRFLEICQRCKSHGK